MFIQLNDGMFENIGCQSVQSCQQYNGDGNIQIWDGKIIWQIGFWIIVCWDYGFDDLIYVVDKGNDQQCCNIQGCCDDDIG